MTIKEHKQELLDQLYDTYKKSDECHVGYSKRTNIVFGEGNPDAKLMLIGEAPGEEEDKQGRPFVGRSGILLNKALALAEINRAELYITNVVKCRPPNNRTPSETEIKTCTEMFLDKQIKIVRPKVIVTLGSIATRALLNKEVKITKIHGQIFNQENFIIIPIYHPSYVLRNRSVIQEWLDDIKRIREIYIKIINQKNEK